MLLGMASGIMFLQAGEAFLNTNEIFNGIGAGSSMMAFAVALVIAAIITVPKDGGDL